MLVGSPQPDVLKCPEYVSIALQFVQVPYISVENPGTKQHANYPSI